MLASVQPIEHESAEPLMKAAEVLPPAPLPNLPVGGDPVTPPVEAKPILQPNPIVEPKPIVEPNPVVEARPIERPKLRPEPVPDADGIIRAQDPVIRTGALPLVAPQPVPPVEPAAPIPTQENLVLPVDGEAPKIKFKEPPAVLTPTPEIKPPTLPSGVIGSSIHQTNASPDVEPTLPALPTDLVPPMPIATNDDSALLRAVRAYQQNRPEEANEHLKACDPASQQMLLSLMPALVRLSEGKLAQMKPEEMDILIEQLTRVPNQLRPKASLQANNVRLCREVHNFAHIEPFPEKHVFRPGDVVYLYLELANFSCVGDAKVGYTISLLSHLELRDAAGKVVWKADPKEAPDRVSTPPRDYYRNFRMCVPNLPAGTYTLQVKSTDQPTGRELDKGVELQIGSK